MKPSLLRTFASASQPSKALLGCALGAFTLLAAGVVIQANGQGNASAPSAPVAAPVRTLPGALVVEKYTPEAAAPRQRAVIAKPGSSRVAALQARSIVPLQSTFKPSGFPLVNERNAPATTKPGTGAGMIAVLPGHTRPNFSRGVSAAGVMDRTVVGTTRVGGVIGYLSPSKYPYSRAQKSADGKVITQCIEPDAARPESRKPTAP